MNKHKEEMDTPSYTRALDIAEKIVYGDREEAYGNPAVNFERISKIWGVILGREVTTEQVAWMMVGFKMSREVNRSSEENLVDAIGYLLTIDRVREHRYNELVTLVSTPVKVDLKVPSVVGDWSPSARSSHA